MKNRIQKSASFLLILAFILACTKEVALKTEVEFSLTEQHKAEGYINENLPTTVTVIPEEILEDFSYSYTYSISKGAGHFMDGTGLIFPQNENIPLNPYSASMIYVGSKAGEHTVKVTASDNFGFTEVIDIKYTVADIPPVVWTATSPVEQIELGKSAVVRVLFEKSEALSDIDYERRYRITNGSGKLTDAPEKDDVALDDYRAIAPGTYQLNFTPGELGMAELTFDLKGNDGEVITAEIAFEVLEDIEDVAPPEIKLEGDDPYIVQRKTEYTDPGAKAFDDVDGDISDAIVINTSELNMARTGTYTITYNVSDSSGRAAKEVTRTVEVIAGDNPESDKNAITAFAIDGQTASSIDPVEYTIAVDVPYGTDLNVSPSELRISDFAEVTPSGTERQDFGVPVIYTVKAENGDEQEWTVMVTVAPKPIVAPTVEAGDDITITLPATSVTLDGSASDADGTVTSEWTIETGGSATIEDPTSTKTTVSGLSAGTYVFRLTAIDDDGATATDTVTVKVNIAPTVLEGSDQNIELPTNTVDLSGRANDEDGEVTSVRWTKESGGTANIEDPNSLNTRITGLAAGTYVFMLTATDDDGATASKGVTVRVAPANIPPMVNAGGDQTFTLTPVPGPGAKDRYLYGTASDEDGTVSVLWTQVNGPTVVIDPPNDKRTQIKDLSPGTYIFRLTATDNEGASAFDDATITVEEYEEPPTAITYNQTTGRYTAPSGSRVTVELRSSGKGKGTANVSGAVSLSTSGNGTETQSFNDSASDSFIMPGTEEVYITGSTKSIFGDISSTVTIDNDQGATRSFSMSDTGSDMP